ncbi:hypothetical protein [Bryobacter aggregatus]|uniref:hypothetical protein n=1 Tax=Bryobacter aggregatus TaxID=360054 RepID=UPI0004E1F3DB|nr:hypothetical protein [Bryobacter aggregatus]
MSQHLNEQTAILAASGDLPALDRLRATAHALVCPACRARIASYKDDASRVRQAVDEFQLPRAMNWAELEGEMYANIRLGLDVSAIRQDFGRDMEEESSEPRISWRAAIAIGTLCATVITGWFLAGPRVNNPYLNRIPGDASVAQVRTDHALLKADRTGVGVESGGSGFLLRSAASQPARVELGLEGSIRSSAVDQDSGQVTVSQIYVE